MQAGQQARKRILTTILAVTGCALASSDRAAEPGNHEGVTKDDALKSGDNEKVFATAMEIVASLSGKVAPIWYSPGK